MSAPAGLDLVWPAEPRTRALAADLYEAVADRPLVSVHNGLPARYLAEDLPFTDPISLLVSHDQGVQAMLRSHGIRTEFSPVDGWQAARASRQAFGLLWRHLADVRGRPWLTAEANGIAPGAELPPFRSDQNPDEVYDALAARLAESPVYPRRVLAAARVGKLATSDDPADDLQAHRVLAEDPRWAGRVVPTFSPDRYLEPDRPAWRTDADLLAEVTGTGTEELAGFLEALRLRRAYFAERGATASEHHSSDLGAARLPDREAGELYRLARSGELLPDEGLALQRHLHWELARMAADDGLVMALYPPAGFRAADPGPAGPGTDQGIAERVRPLLADFGADPRFRLRLFTIDVEAYRTEIVPLAAAHPALVAVPPTRFADHPATLRAARTAAVAALGARRCLGMVDDMSGPFALAARHRFGRRLDAGALAELVVAGRLDREQAGAELAGALDQASS